MRSGNRIVLKLSAVVVAVVTLMLALLAWLALDIGHRYTLESSRTIVGFNSDSVARAVEALMMGGNRAAIGDHFHELAGDSEIYDEIRLISHLSGEVVSSRTGRVQEPLEPESRACAECHAFEDPSLGGDGPRDWIIDDPEKGRQLTMLTPLVNQPSCGSAACHAHEESGHVLGLLEIDYSLDALDPTATARITRTAIGAAVAIVLCALAIRLLMRGLLEKPIERLVKGTRRIAEGDLEFRFNAERQDELGVLQASFNTMSSRLLAHQAELKNAMEYLRGIIESSADIIITVTPRGRIQTFNRGAEQTLGYSRDEVQGERVEILFADPKDREYALTQLSETDHVRNFRTRFLTKEGEERIVLLSLSRLRDGGGNAIGTFGISKDITEETRLLKQVIRAKKMAAIGEAATGIQHAIKNMLNALKGGAYLVRNGIMKHNRQRLEEGWGMVEEGIERMTALSLNLLNYAKDWHPELEEVDLNHMVSKVHEVVKQSASDKNVATSVELTDESAVVRCDPKLIHMAVMDIVSNAVDACTWKEYESGDAPAISLRTFSSESGNQLNIEIRDNGSGMSKVILKNIFTPFFSTKKKWGTGLGLALTSRVIDVHGGAIDVESEPGKGTMFRIVLPRSGPSEVRKGGRKNDPENDPESDPKGGQEGERN
jgi:PAS domain S-box-containing protein